MLRNLVLGLACLTTLAGVALLLAFPPAGLQLLIFGALLLVGTLGERIVYKRVAPGAPDVRFRRTAERFRDPTSGEPVTVYADPATGERAYVRE
jgi:hypothetical protein